MRCIIGRMADGGTFLNPRFVMPPHLSSTLRNGGKLRFMTAGGSWPDNALDTYPTAADRNAATNANANPVVSDSSGVFGAIYGKTDQKYKVVLLDSADTTVFTADNYSFPALHEEGVVDRLKQGFRSPLDYGGIGDGAQDEQTEVQAAIDAAETDGTYVVDLLGLNWRCDSSLTLHSDLKLKNGKLDFTNDTSAEHIIIRGTQGASVALSANLNAGGANISTADTSTAAVGQWIHVGDTSDWDTAGNVDQGQLRKIKSIVANTTITPYGPSHLSLTTANSAQWTPLTMLSNIVLEDLEIVCGTDSGTTALVIDMAERVRVRNVKFTGAPNVAIETRLAVNVSIIECEVGPETVSTSNGVVISECSRNVTVCDCIFYGLDISLSVGNQVSGGLSGICTEVIVEKCKFYGATTTNISGAAGTHILKILDNYIEGRPGAGDEGIDCRGANTTISGNELYWCDGTAIWYASEVDTTATLYQQVHASISKNIVHECQTTISILVGSDQATAVSVTDNEIYNPSGYGIYSDQSVFQSLKIQGNTIASAALDCIHLTANGTCVNAIVSGNILSEDGSGGNDLIYLDHVITDGVVSDNICDKTNDTNDGVNINPTKTTGTFSVHGNKFNNGDYGIRVGTTTATEQYGNSFTGTNSGNVTGTFTPTRASGRNGAGSNTSDGTIELDLT